MPNRHSDDEKPSVSTAFRGLSDPYRLTVFTCLQDLEMKYAQGGDETNDMPSVIEYVARSANMDPAMVEQHLLELQRSGLVRIEEAAGGVLRVSIDHRRTALIRRLLSPGSPGSG